MSETLHNGFSPGNVERIYRGEPALVDGQLPRDILGVDRWDTLSLIADGLNQREAQAVMGINIYDMRQYTAVGLSRLGIVSRSQLAGFFPMDAEHEAVRNKKLADLPTKAKSLAILQDLSIGRPYEEVATEFGKGGNGLGGHLAHINQFWPGIRGQVLLSRVANALRTRCVQAVESHFGTLESGYLHEFTLPVLSAIEPAIERQFMVTGDLPYGDNPD